MRRRGTAIEMEIKFYEKPSDAQAIRWEAEATRLV
jgi:hypothetical protein